MEDLAFLVLIIMSILLISGPINIALTSRRVQRFTSTRKVLHFLRRIIAGVIGLVGVFIAIQFLIESLPLLPKFFALSALVGNGFALWREIKFVQQKNL